MSTQQVSEPAGLANLPCEIHLEIFSYLCPIGEALSFVTTCNKIYNNSIVEFYKVYAPPLNWLPLVVGISQDNTRILDKCEKAGASLNHRWPYLGKFGSTSDTEYFRPCQPLDLATWYGQKKVLEWLAERKAVDTDQDNSNFVMMTDAECFVSDLKTTEGSWRPIMYQQGLRFSESYPPNPPPHFVWHSSNIKCTEIFPRLLQLYCGHHSLASDIGDCTGLANWVAWIWLHMLLSSSDPARILKSGFFQGAGRNKEELYFFSHFASDLFGQKSLIYAVRNLTQYPFSKYASRETTRLISRLLDSRADGHFIASVYITMLDCAALDKSNLPDDSSTIELYERVLRALKDSQPRSGDVMNFRQNAVQRWNLSPESRGYIILQWYMS